MDNQKPNSLELLPVSTCMFVLNNLVVHATANRLATYVRCTIDDTFQQAIFGLHGQSVTQELSEAQFCFLPYVLFIGLASRVHIPFSSGLTALSTKN